MKRRLDKSIWRELRTAHASGLGLRELARNMDIPAGTVLARAKREGWTQQNREAKALCVKTLPPAVPVAVAVARTMAERGQRHVERMAGVVEKTVPYIEQLKPGAILDRIEDLDRLDKVARRTFGLRERDNLAVQVNILSLTQRPPVPIEHCADVREIEASGHAAS